MATKKDPAAVAMGKKRMASMTSEERIALATSGGAARMKKLKKKGVKEFSQIGHDKRWAEVRKAKAAEAKKAKES